jgi:hypothetical protein
MSRSGSSGGGGLSGYGNRQQQVPGAGAPIDGAPNPPYTFHPRRTIEPPHSPYNFDDENERFNVDNNAIFPVTQRPPAGRGGDIFSMMTSKAPASTGATPPMSMAVLTLIIVASLCLVVGAIYLLIYFKSIKPMSARSRSYADPGGGKGDDDGGARKSAGHPFFRRK